MKLGLSLLRAIVGLLFVGHGTQKLFGWFGGHGPDGTAQMFDSIGLRPGRTHAMAAGAAEAGGGALITLGLFTPAAAAAIMGTMATAIRTVHFKNGPWATDGGYEYNLSLIAIMIALADLGPGEFSLDHALGIEVKGPLVALTAAAGGIAAATYMTTRSAAPEPTPASQVSAQQSPPAEAAADQSRGTIDGQPLSASTNA